MPPQTDEVTLGEVFRGVQALGKDLREFKTHLDRRPTWEDVNRLEAARDLAAKLQDEAIKALEDTHTWLARTVFGTLITAGVAIVGMVINSTRIPG